MTSNSTYTFQVGNFQCTVLADDISHLEISSIPDRFPDVPRQALLSALEKRHASTTTIEWSMNCLLVQRDDRNIMVDTGMGGEGGKLIPRLREILPLREIDTVIITHCHPDHVGGLVAADGALTFPNAEYWMRETEWEYWMGTEGIVHRGDDRYAQLLRAKLLPIQDRLTLLTQDREIVPGITAFSAFGHTPGHIGLLIESEGEKLFDIVDALHAKVQLDHPDWSPRFDVDPVQASQTRKALLERAAEEEMPTLLYHFGFPGIGLVSRQGDGFLWEPWPDR